MPNHHSRFGHCARPDTYYLSGLQIISQLYIIITHISSVTFTMFISRHFKYYATAADHHHAMMSNIEPNMLNEVICHYTSW